ncbi:lactonase family protein [Streptomyces sp. NPDC049954]|uniref:lactonase family protein n=1 Tax=Streptomyces sp. NPDC049954 TaxID=3155779 RepID=UPI00341422FC
MSGTDAGRAYIGSFTAAGGRGVLTASVDPRTGALSVLDSLDSVPDPSYLVLAPGAGRLYAVSEATPGAVAAFDTTGERPRPLGAPVPVDGDGPTHLTLFDGHVLTANYNSGSVSALALRPDGSLDPEPNVVVHKGSGPHPQRQQEPHAHQVLADPSGRWAVSVDLGTDSLRVLRLVGGAPVVHREIAMRPRSGPRHLAFHPDGRHLYVLNELSPTLTVCRWDAAEGDLRALSETALLPQAPAGDAYGSAVRVSPDGRFLWAGVRGEDVVSVFALGADGSTTRLVTTVPCGGEWPRDVAIDPSGRFLYTANERSGTVVWFVLDPGTGLPRRAGSVEAPAASCVVFA